MYIQNKPASALYKMFIGILAAVGFWLSIAEFGLSAWRLFSTSVLLVATVYFLISALAVALSKKRNSGQVPCPMLEGALIVSFSLLCVATIVYHLQGVAFPGAGGWHASLIYFVLPFLVLSDWLLFTKKGQWYLRYPLYWVAPAVVYAAPIILTAPDLPESDPLRYPVEFLNFYEGDLIITVEWFALIGALMLVYSYILILIDCAASGKISQHIVLPHVKTIVLEDEPAEPAEPQPKEPPIERVEVKLEPMKQPPRRSPKPKAKTAQTQAQARTKARSQGQSQTRSRTKNTDGVKPSNNSGNKAHKKPTPKSTNRPNNSATKKKPAPSTSTASTTTTSATSATTTTSPAPESVADSVPNSTAS